MKETERVITVPEKLIQRHKEQKAKVENDTKSYFRGRTAEQQLKMKADYEHVISLAKGDIPGPDSGKLKYMIPHWEEGLEILNDVINERSQPESRAPHAI